MPFSYSCVITSYNFVRLYVTFVYVVSTVERSALRSRATQQRPRHVLRSKYSSFHTDAIESTWKDGRWSVPGCYQTNWTQVFFYLNNLNSLHFKSHPLGVKKSHVKSHDNPSHVYDRGLTIRDSRTKHHATCSDDTLCHTFSVPQRKGLRRLSPSRYRTKYIYM